MSVWQCAVLVSLLYLITIVRMVEGIATPSAEAPASVAASTGAPAGAIPELPSIRTLHSQIIHAYMLDYQLICSSNQQYSRTKYL